MSRVRKVIARRMQASLHDTAQLTSVLEADLTGVMNLRRVQGHEFKARYGVGLSPLAVVAHAAMRALADHPVLNASVDDAAGTVTEHGHVNLGIAVDTPAGLIVPNLKNAHELDVPGLATGIADLAARARGRGLKPEDIEGGTFTITNTGSRGSVIDTPILNSPEVGILAVGAVERRPVAVGSGERESVQIRDRAYLCLTYDHRLVDGADAARYLGSVAGLVGPTDVLDPERPLPAGA